MLDVNKLRDSISTVVELLPQLAELFVELMEDERIRQAISTLSDALPEQPEEDDSNIIDVEEVRDADS